MMQGSSQVPRLARSCVLPQTGAAHAAPPTGLCFNALQGHGGLRCACFQSCASALAQRAGACLPLGLLPWQAAGAAPGGVPGPPHQMAYLSGALPPFFSLSSNTL